MSQQRGRPPDSGRGKQAQREEAGFEGRGQGQSQRRQGTLLQMLEKRGNGGAWNSLVFPGSPDREAAALTETCSQQPQETHNSCLRRPYHLIQDSAFNEEILPMNNDILTAAGWPDPVQQENSPGQGLSMLAPAGELLDTPTSGHTPAHWARFPVGGIHPGTGIFKSCPRGLQRAAQFEKQWPQASHFLGERSWEHGCCFCRGLSKMGVLPTPLPC